MHFYVFMSLLLAMLAGFATCTGPERRGVAYDRLYEELTDEEVFGPE